MNKNIELVRPYGDTLNDGKVQLSFSLPLPLDLKSEEAAKRLAIKMGVQNPIIVHTNKLSEHFSYFIIYGTLEHQISVNDINIEIEDKDEMTKEEVEDFISKNFNKDIVFIGASTGTDAHTVGIDAIMNMKGFNGNYGLERYKGIKAINLGGQIENEKLLKEAINHHADVILISQTVTQKDIHIQNLTKFIELLEAENLRDRFIVFIGGPRINNALAKELGYDAGFGSKKYAYHVASTAIKMLHQKSNNK